MTRYASRSRIGGVILAGGLSSRMNFLDKPLIPIANRSLIEYVIANAIPQLSRLVISVNRNLAKYTRYDLPLVEDVDNKFSGPLVGIYSAMNWYKKQNISVDYLACFPADVPIFPDDIVSRLKQALEKKEQAENLTNRKSTNVAWCQTGNQIQPLFSLWSLELLSTVEQSIKEGICGPKFFFQHHPSLKVQLPAPVDGSFLNINTPEDLATAEMLLTKKCRD